MTKFYCQQFRTRVVEAILSGASIRAAASQYDLPPSTARLWHRQFLQDGRLEALPTGGDRHSHRSKQHAERILGWVGEQPDITIDEIREKLGELGYSLARSTIWALLRREGYTRKKKTGPASEQERDDVKAQRQKWIAAQKSLSGDKVVFIDECSINTKMARSHGWSKRGTPCEVPLPHGHWKTTTLVAGLSSRGMLAPMALDGPMDGHAFLAWVKQVLAKKLRKGDTVVCDNLAVHKIPGVRKILAKVGAKLLFLPPYSPDLNPIEKAFSQIKSFLRKIAARTIDDLLDATGKAIGLVSQRNANSYITACGYPL